MSCRLCRRAPCTSIAASLRPTERRGCSGWLQRMAQEMTRDRSRIRLELLGVALGHDGRRPGARRPAPGRSRARRGGSCPRRARRRSACCPWRQAARACRAARGCRADAARWWARRGCSRRRAGSNPAARRGGCAGPRRPRGLARRDRARGSRGPTCSRKPRREISSARMSRAISCSRPATASFSKNVLRLRDRLRAHVGDGLAAEANRERFAIEALAVALGQVSSSSSHSTQESSTWSSVPVFERSSSHFTSSIFRPVP